MGYEDRQRKDTEPPSPLLAWMRAANVGESALARALGTCRRTIFLYKMGKMLPGLVMAALIQRITDGHVPMESWLGTDEARRQIDKYANRTTVEWTPSGVVLRRKRRSDAGKSKKRHAA